MGAVTARGARLLAAPVVLFLAFGSVALGPAAARGQEVVATEYAVKAAFLYHFAKFTEWPAEAGGPTPPVVHLCVLGDDPFGKALEELSDRGADGLRVDVRHVNAVEAEPRCHVVFISGSEGDRLAEHLARARRDGVLTVSDLAGFAHAGGVIQFVLEEGKVRFWINRAAAERGGLHLSSRLLALARIVDGSGAPER
jgi:YfiR/HmsC-like